MKMKKTIMILNLNKLNNDAHVKYLKEKQLNVKIVENSSSADGGPRSRVRAWGTLCSAPHRH